MQGLMQGLTIRTRRNGPMPRVSVCVDDDLLQAIDAVAAEAGALRSDVIRTALEELLQRRVTTPQETTT